MFGDASEVAYGVVAYLAGRRGPPVLVSSRARVAPVRKLKVARLELLAILLSARHAVYLRACFKKTIPHLELRVFLWSDACIVIAWSRTYPSRLKTWVCNRVQEIQDLSQPGAIRHVAGVENPADMCSRGVSPAALRDSRLWWHGPMWLEDWTPTEVGDTELSKEEEEIAGAERKKDGEYVAVAAIVVEPRLSDLLERCASLNKLVRVTAWLLRARYNLDAKALEERRRGELSAAELRESTRWWIRRAQADVYPDEIRRLNGGKQIPSKSKLIGCPSFLDVDGVLKLVDRTAGAAPVNALVILPPGHWFMTLVIEDAHRRLCHSWIKITFTTLLRTYWIVNGRREMKRALLKCALCRKLMSRPIRQPPGPLPAARCTVGEPFEAVGIDFAGPLYVRRRDGATAKVYVCLFTCARTRAVHLEMVSDLATPRFIMAFDRFVARRGLCREIYSDNAKTFKKAELEFRAAWRRLRKCPELQRHFASEGVAWRFLSERAPWWGGFWERLVHSIKVSLKKILGRTSLTEEELATTLTRVEATINSRPITYTYADARDLEPLSLADLFIG